MKLPSKKLITTGLLLIPLFLLAVYTFNGGRMQSKNKRISVSKLKLSTPTDTINEIASYIEEGDMETALTKINELLKDPNIPNSKGLPLLVLAAEKNDTELVATLLQLGANPNFAAVGSGESALMKAAANDNFAMVQVLVNANSDVNATSIRGYTPLTMAIKAKNRAMVEYLISRGARAGVSKDNLLIYAFQKSPVGVEAMLKGGINPNFKDKNGNTPLIIAAASGDFESIQYLLAYRAEINAVNNLGMTPLLYAIKAKRLDIIPYLLDRGAEVNTANNLGETPLYWAAYLGLDKITQDLLQLGADYNKKTNKNITALQIAITNGHKTTQKVIADFIAFKNIPRDKNGNPIVKTNEATTGATSSKKTKTTAKSASKATNNAASKAAANNIAATTGSPDVQNMAANGIIPVYQGAQPADATPPAPANTSTNDNWMKPKTEKPSTQKTQINKLKTSNNR